MRRKTTPNLILTDEERKLLKTISTSRKEKHSKVERAKYILDYSNGESVYSIAKKYGENHQKIEKVIKKAIQYGAITSLSDLPGKGKRKTITEDARLWFLNIACTSPKELSLPFETWSMSSLAKYVREHCEEEGFSVLSNIQKGTVYKLLSKSNIKPHKVKYYLKKTDLEFKEKMYNVLHIYKEIELAKENGNNNIIVISYDEKPGVQAIGNVHPDLQPKIDNVKISNNIIITNNTNSNKNNKTKESTILRDSHYKRYGTVSVLSGIDLLTGEIRTIVRDTHSSSDFIEFLKYLNDTYPKDSVIKVILDNHSVHTSKETKKYLEENTGRFEFIFTPKHGSWLNIIEVFFSKLQRCLLKNIRVSSKEELKERILSYIDMLNKEPVIFRWSWGLNEVSI